MNLCTYCWLNHSRLYLICLRVLSKGENTKCRTSCWECFVRSPSRSTSACGLFLSCPPVRNNHSILLLTLQGIVGNLSSGKSALVHRYLTGTYVQEESPEGKSRLLVVWVTRWCSTCQILRKAQIFLFTLALGSTWQDMSIFFFETCNSLFPLFIVLL